MKGCHLDLHMQVMICCMNLTRFFLSQAQLITFSNYFTSKEYSACVALLSLASCKLAHKGLCKSNLSSKSVMIQRNCWPEMVAVLYFCSKACIWRNKLKYCGHVKIGKMCFSIKTCPLSINSCIVSCLLAFTCSSAVGSAHTGKKKVKITLLLVMKIVQLCNMCHPSFALGHKGSLLEEKKKQTPLHFVQLAFRATHTWYSIARRSPIHFLFALEHLPKVSELETVRR